VLKIATQSDPAGAGRVLLAGSVCEDSLDELARALAAAAHAHREIIIDLSEVTLVDRLGLQFLAAQREKDVKLIQCPEYIEPWIDREVLGHRTKFSSPERFRR
jgi:anti-anti-sigma regulatory factor